MTQYNCINVKIHRSPNVISESNDDTNLSTQVAIKLSKSHLSRIKQSGGLVDTILEPLLKVGLPLKKNVLKPLDESFLISLGLAAKSDTNAGTYEGTAILIISNEEIEDMKTVKCFKKSGLLIKGVSKTIKNEANEQKVDFLALSWVH